MRAWYDEVCKTAWTQPADIKAQYRHASILRSRRAVFNIKGNDRAYWGMGAMEVLKSCLTASAPVIPD